MEWWDAPEYDREIPMAFSRRDDGPVRRVTDATDPVMYRGKHGQLRLRLITALDANGQRRPKLRIFI